MVQRCGPAPAGLGVGATILCAADVNAARVVRRGRWDGITHRVVDGPAIGSHLWCWDAKTTCDGERQVPPGHGIAGAATASSSGLAWKNHSCSGLAMRFLMAVAGCYFVPFSGLNSCCWLSTFGHSGLRQYTSHGDYVITQRLRLIRPQTKIVHTSNTGEVQN